MSGHAAKAQSENQPEDANRHPNRMPDGRFLPGHKLSGPGNAGRRINVALLARRKAKEYGLDLDTLMWDVVLAMLLKGANGDVSAAALAHKMLGELEPKGPALAIGISTGGGAPEPPALRARANGAPPLDEHLRRLVAIARERGLADIVDAEPVDAVTTIINRAREEKNGTPKKS
jgi:hypothetical protein